MANDRFVGLSPLSVVLLKWPGWAALALLMLVACAQSPAPQAAMDEEYHKLQNKGVCNYRP